MGEIEWTLSGTTLRGRCADPLRLDLDHDVAELVRERVGNNTARFEIRGPEHLVVAAEWSGGRWRFTTLASCCPRTLFAFARENDDPSWRFPAQELDLLLLHDDLPFALPAEVSVDTIEMADVRPPFDLLARARELRCMEYSGPTELLTAAEMTLVFKWKVPPRAALPVGGRIYVKALDIRGCEEPQVWRFMNVAQVASVFCTPEQFREYPGVPPLELTIAVFQPGTERVIARLQERCLTTTQGFLPTMLHFTPRRVDYVVGHSRHLEPPSRRRPARLEDEDLRLLRGLETKTLSLQFRGEGPGAIDRAFVRPLGVEKLELAWERDVPGLTRGYPDPRE